MLIKTYNLYYDKNNTCKPFIICNADVKGIINSYNVSEQELAAPGLKIKPRKKTRQAFWEAWSTDASVIDNIKNNDGEWKVVRVVVDPTGVYFTVVNPELIHNAQRDGQENTDQNSLSAGCVIAKLDSDLGGAVKLRFAVSILQPQPIEDNLGSEKLSEVAKYRLSVCESYIELTEREKKFTRKTSLFIEEELGDSYALHVQEVYK